MRAEGRKPRAGQVGMGSAAGWPMCARSAAMPDKPRCGENLPDQRSMLRSCGWRSADGHQRASLRAAVAVVTKPAHHTVFILVSPLAQSQQGIVGTDPGGHRFRLTGSIRQLGEVLLAKALPQAG